MQVKVCVDCGEEYRPDIQVCADCGGQLEPRPGDEERPRAAMPASEERSADPDADFTTTVLHADRASDLRTEADRLVEAGIDFRLRASGRGAGYELLVTAEDRERALESLGLLTDAPSAPGGERACPACGTAVQKDVTDCPECGLTVGDEPETDE
jgi:RNA polymerase subunit RPABC4/transcription elongation factor Spt4